MRGEPDSDAGTTAIIGGGISGVAAAVALIDRGIPVTLFEASDRLGGKIAETTVDGIVCPTGPDAFLSRRPEVADLAKRLGLGAELIHPSAGSARIYRNGQLHRLPPNVLGVPATAQLEASGLISSAGAARASKDLTDIAPDPPGDETVGALVRRRLGDEVLEYLVDPLLGGINAGDSDRLSLEHGVPQLADLRRSGPSLMRAAADRIARAQKPSAPVFTGVKGGLNRLLDTAAETLDAAPNGQLRTGETAHLTRSGASWSVNGQNFDHVVCATPARSTAQLIEDAAPAAAAELLSIPYASVALTVLVLPEGTLPLDPTVSGVLVPRQCGLTVTAVSFASHKWPALAPDGRQILRVSVGRRTDTQWRARSDEALLTMIRADLSTILGTPVPDSPAAITRWIEALPQFEVGHGDRIERLDAAIEAQQGLHLIGAWRDGLGLPACVATAQDVVQGIPV